MRLADGSFDLRRIAAFSTRVVAVAITAAAVGGGAQVIAEAGAPVFRLAKVVTDTALMVAFFAGFGWLMFVAERRGREHRAIMGGFYRSLDREREERD